MRKSNLENGMIIKFKGEKDGHLVCDNRFEGLHGYMNIEDYNEDLIYVKRSNYIDSKNWDIQCVYRMVLSGTGLINLLKDVENNIYIEKIWERKREIDNSKIPFGTKVIVSDRTKDLDEFNGLTMKFISYEPRLREYPFIVTESSDENATSYKYCKIHPSVEIKEEWYK